MTRTKAIEAMDRFNAAGYTVKLIAAPAPPGYAATNIDPDTNCVYHVFIKIADELGLDCGLSAIERGELSFMDPDPRAEVVRTPRRHPR